MGSGGSRLKLGQRTRREEMFDWIAEYVSIHHNAPSSYIIASAFGISRQAVDGHLLKLVKEKKVEYVDGCLRLKGAEYIPPDER
jgi:predicted transcriptional regulator